MDESYVLPSEDEEEGGHGDSNPLDNLALEQKGFLEMIFPHYVFSLPSPFSSSSLLLSLYPFPSSGLFLTYGLLLGTLAVLSSLPSRHMFRLLRHISKENTLAVCSCRPMMPSSIPWSPTQPGEVRAELLASEAQSAHVSLTMCPLCRPWQLPVGTRTGPFLRRWGVSGIKGTERKAICRTSHKNRPVCC